MAICLITFSCYGSHLRGDERGWVDRSEMVPGVVVLEGDARLAEADRWRLRHAPLSLDERARILVLESIKETCSWRGWGLMAAHVRSEHVHVVVNAEVTPERVMADLKAYSSRRLNEVGPRMRRRWTRRASTRWLNSAESVVAALRYVAEGQGTPMAVYVAEMAER